jgi:hypothetical protein
MQKIAGQSDRDCVARLLGMTAPLALRTFDVKTAKKNPRQVATYLRRIYKRLKFALPMPEAKRLMEERQAKLIEKMRRPDEPITAGQKIRRSSRRT